MTVKGIDLNMKWNNYGSDTIYLWNGHSIFQISEGIGDNLLDEDIEEGYVDYWITECRTLDKEKSDEGGQWMETKLISEIDYTIQGVIDRMSKCDLWEDDWEVIDEDLGSELMNVVDLKNVRLRMMQNDIDKMNIRINQLVNQLKERRK